MSADNIKITIVQESQQRENDGFGGLCKKELDRTPAAVNDKSVILPAMI